MGSLWRRSVELIALCALASCSGAYSLQRPLDPDSAKQLSGRWLARTERRSADFSSSKPMAHPLAAMGGLLGVLIDSGLDSGDVEGFDENRVVDPARAISRQLRHDLERHYGLRHARRAVPFDADDATKLAALDPSADVVIDVWTEDLSLLALREDTSKFHLHYVAGLRLIDARAPHPIDGKTGLVIAEGTCERAPDDPASAATREQLLADGARRLKSELEQATQTCIRDFRARLLRAE